MVRWQIDRDIEKYNAYAEKQAENGRKGGRPKKATETQKTQAFSEKPKKANTKEKEKNISTNVDNPPTPLDKAMTDFKEHRKQIRKPLSDRGAELLCGQLEKLAPGDERKKIAILEQSIANGWTGVFDLKQDRLKARRGTGANAPYAQHEFSDADFEDIFVDLSRVEV
jgi:hypothetical protein